MVVVVVGAVLGYYKFLKVRVYEMRLEPKVSGRLICVDGKQFIAARASVKNVGVSKVDFDRSTGYDLYLPEPEEGFTEVKWKQEPLSIAAFGQEYIEAGETIEEERLIALPSGEFVAFNLVLSVVTKEEMWRSTTIINAQIGVDSQTKPA